MLNKYARAEPDWTPNNYDITINKKDIQENLSIPSIIELSKEVKDLIPVTKKLHLILEEDTQYFTPVLRFTTTLYTNKGDKLI